MRKRDPRAQFEKLAGEAFILELCPRSIVMLLKAHQMDVVDLAFMVDRSVSFIEKVCRGEKAVSQALAEQLAKLFSIKPIKRFVEADTFYCELTGRSLHVMRQAAGLTTESISEKTKLNADHLRRFQRGDRPTLGDEYALILGELLKINFLFIPK